MTDKRQNKTRCINSRKSGRRTPDQLVQRVFYCPRLTRPLTNNKTRKGKTMTKSKFEQAADNLMSYVASLTDGQLLDAMHEAKEFEMRFVLLCEAEMRGLV